MLRNLCNEITIPVATAMIDSTIKKTFVSKQATTMLHLMSFYLAPNKNQVSTLILGKFTKEMDKIMNTKNKYETVIVFQSAITSYSNNLTNSFKLGLTSMYKYIDPSPKAYNVPKV